MPRHCSPGEMVFGQGQPCSGLYAVECGHIRIFKSAANGREQVLSIDGPGSSVAEIPVFDGGCVGGCHRQCHTALCQQAGFSCTLPCTSPSRAQSTLRGVGGTLATARRDHRRTFVHEGAPPPLFLTTSGPARRKRAEGGGEIALPANQDLASQIGTVRELVSRLKHSLASGMGVGHRFKRGEGLGANDEQRLLGV